MVILLNEVPINNSVCKVMNDFTAAQERAELERKLGESEFELGQLRRGKESLEQQLRREREERAAVEERGRRAEGGHQEMLQEQQGRELALQ